MKNIHKGSNFEAFLEEENILEEIDALATKQIIALKIEKMMEKNHISKSEMARRMNTQRNVIYDLLNPDKDCKITTIAKAAKVFGKKIKINLVSS